MKPTDIYAALCDSAYQLAQIMRLHFLAYFERDVIAEQQKTLAEIDLDERSIPGRRRAAIEIRAHASDRLAKIQDEILRLQGISNE